MSQLVLGIDETLDMSDQLRNREKKLVSQNLVFKMFPEALNHVQIRRIRRQPTDEDAGFKQAEKSLDEMAVMKRRIIQNQHERLGWIVYPQKLFQEGQKGEGILGRRSL